jgi:hypothetical protein
MMFEGLEGFGADSAAGPFVSRGSDGSASLGGRTTREGGEDGGIVLSLKSD